MTIVRHTTCGPVNLRPCSIWRPTSSWTQNASDAGHSAANTTTLPIGTEANNGWFSGLSTDHSHQRSCGPRWSKIS
nr:hypothetical protein CPGR_00590 [Mycolicibacter nonchromogenicus]